MSRQLFNLATVISLGLGVCIWLQADNGLPRLERRDVFVLNGFGVFVNYRVEHPASTHSHSLRDVVEVGGNLWLQTDTGVVPALMFC